MAGYKSQRQRNLIAARTDQIVKGLTQVGYSLEDAVAKADARVTRHLQSDRRTAFRWLTGRGPAAFKRFKV